MTITIRKINEADFPKMLELFKAFAAFEKLPEKMTNSLDRMIKEKAFLNGFVAETSDKDIVAYVTCFHCYYTWTGKSLYMDDLYVQPAYRAHGIGTQLLNAVIKFAKETECHKLRWQVSDWNTAAIDFYKKMGATIDSVEKNCDLLLN